MQDSLYVALSSQIALERRLDTIADNVANASTIGFRATGVKFEDVVSGTGPKSVSFASSGNTYLSGAHGALTETGNPFDFAIQGDAWFAIDTPAGTVMTRDGRFSMNENGELMSIEGYPVLDSGGAPIQLDPRNGPPKAGADGSLRQNDQLVGAIGLYNFDPGENFVRYGNSGIVPARTPEPVTDRSDLGVAQGFLEESNVNPVLEMTRLIQVQRAFENTAALMRQTDSSTDDAIKTLGSK
ncbi:flagellar basal-body rod protein FlgF [Mesorhizobium sp. M2A.F.Ca.ET.037.01.1.1]|uniref:flagellar basal-body rod protein FlgF n=1 Tax=unclassified Mesorhizobium TaxID=325217 RepID=UPI000F75B1D2|nr:MULTISPECIES: flagellar basal-body rod protein FlgF [unclassified Mesorhizobium]RUX99899.1 flagellar basal-body rod protein FlgF [Mesorhizobium sp. M2A.F.Ca.ET.040.01.1.1]RVC73884.1 flagellar basal-body rod protein FlgF [Mesorhizobium sp. M2A.F.Ca.ET.046.02.1.1]AZO37069.1 flagellar basal-body rod protein FlgF [Mesorhizobium sp. M2A.F.Ca.ET.046.03.2.1]RUX05120.1 flagellar basal-body rod protein FlgF [Mesorhizobium sp. M2A.F.Ca.ET.037.01.1.1]RWA92071.1 MAG: flagellar basal-body rod protein Fl